jgi:deoxyinosine 3'endonuclease (endonuclease V)
MFEMISSDNPIIISYETDNIVLTGVRDMTNFQEVNILETQFDTFDRPTIYGSYDVNTIDPNLCEGFVIVFNDFTRMKIKTSEYVKKSFMFPLCTNRKSTNINLHILKVIQESEEKEFCTYCPEYADLIKTVKILYNDFIKTINDMYSTTIQNITSRKDYALNIQQYNKLFHKYLFVLYENRNLDTYVASIKTKKLYKDIFSKTPTKIKSAQFAPIPRSEWEQYQIEKSKEIILTDSVDIKNVVYIGGLDISFDKMDDSRGCAYLTIYDVKNQKIVHEDYKVCTLTVPYVSGFLGFREIPEYIELLEKIANTQPQYYPQVLMVDGFGILHHRGFGSASHIGYEMGISSIGVAKTLLFVDGLDEKEIKLRFKNECSKKGDYIELIGKSGKKYGAALKSSPSVENPLYISVGHKISLESAIQLALNTSVYRIPEPIRNSDIKSKLYL